MAGQVNLAGRKVSPKQAKTSEALPPATVRSPIRIPSYTTITHMQRV